LARSLKRPADGPDGRIIEKTYRNKSKNKATPRAPLRGYPTVFYGGRLGRNWEECAMGGRRYCKPEHRQYFSYCGAGLSGKLANAGG
jgi:hypothetical protein